MPVDDVSKVRNIAILGQGGVGKTTLADALLFAAGGVPRFGRVDDGTSHFDHEPEESKHRVSIACALATLSWQKHEVTIVDTPGYANFLAETRGALRAVDGGILVLPPGAQVKVELERLWSWAGEEGVACIGFVGHLDRDAANLDALFERVGGALHAKLVALTLPLGEGAELRGFVDLVRRQALVFDGSSAKPKVEPIPDEIAAAADAARERLVETVAEASDDLLEKYLEEGELSEEDLRAGLRAGTIARKFVPVLVGCAPQLVGVQALLDQAIELLPSPADRPPMIARHAKTGDPVEITADPSAPFAAYVFKTMIDPFAGRLSLIRVHSGVLKPDSTVWNANREVKEHVGPVLQIDGKKQHAAGEAVAGQIVAVAKLKETLTGDTLTTEKEPLFFDPPPETPTAISFAIEPKTKADEEKANQSLARLLEEDSALRVHRDSQTREIILSGAGQLHVEIVVERLKRKYGVEVELKAPKVPYRETIKAKANAQGKYKKQSGGRGQYGDCWLEIEPLARSGGFEFVDKIVGGVIPRNFIPAVEKGIREAMQEGFVAGFPMQDVRVTCYDGSHHSVDSSEMAFKIAGSIGFKAAVEKAKPILLEPLMKLAVTVPDDAIGDVIGDLNGRRGKVSGVEPGIGEQVIHALVPMSEVLRYAPDLRSMTSGRGQFTMEFSHYDEVPAHLAPKIAEAARAAKAGA
jgi:elongation factor G